MLEQQQTMQIEMGYGRLFEVLQLNPEETAHLKNLLLEREKTQTDMALKMMDPNITQEQRAALVKVACSWSPVVSSRSRSRISTNASTARTIC